MIDRRRFLGGVLGLASGGRAILGATDVVGRERPGLADDSAYRRYLADVAACDLNTLGVPRWKSLIEAGHHPVAPSRVVVVDDGELRRLSRSHLRVKRWLRKEEARCRERWPADPSLPSAKLDLCGGLMDRITSHYLRPDLFERWAQTLGRRELLGSTGIGYGLGLLHDFQHHGTAVGTDNGVVDWWLVLLPGGVDWQALDDQPVFYMVGPVLTQRQPGTYLRVMEAISRGMRFVVRADGFDPGAWSARLAALPPDEAAREFNFLVTRGLARSGSPSTSARHSR